MHSEVCGIDATRAALETRHLNVDIVARHRGPLGPLLSARRAELEARGQLAAGQEFEEVLVLRGRRGGKTSVRWPILITSEVCARKIAGAEIPDTSASPPAVLSSLRRVN